MGSAQDYRSTNGNEPISLDEERWGLTKREYFSAMAMKCMIESENSFAPHMIIDGILWADTVGERAVLYANALIRALNQSTHGGDSGTIKA